MFTFLGYILQLIIKPQRGWEDVAEADPKARQLLRRGLYPFILVVAMTCLVRVFYFIDMTIVTALQDAIITAVSYFATFFIADYTLSLRLPALQSPDAVADSERTQVFVIFNIGILLLISAISNLLPFDVALLQYLPLYTVFVIWKGATYLGIDAIKIGHFMFLAVLAVIIPVYLLGYFFHLFV